MEPTKIKVELGQFRVTDRHLNAIRVALGEGVNIWIHMGFEHSIQPGDNLTLFTELPHANTRPTPEQ